MDCSLYQRPKALVRCSFGCYYEMNSCFRTTGKLPILIEGICADLTKQIFFGLKQRDLLTCTQVCQLWRSFVCDHAQMFAKQLRNLDEHFVLVSILDWIRNEEKKETEKITRRRLFHREIVEHKWSKHYHLRVSIENGLVYQYNLWGSYHHLGGKRDYRFAIDTHFWKYEDFRDRSCGYPLPYKLYYYWETYRKLCHYHLIRGGEGYDNLESDEYYHLAYLGETLFLLQQNLNNQVFRGRKT